MGGLDRKPGGNSLIQPSTTASLVRPGSVGKNTLVEQAQRTLPPVQLKPATTAGTATATEASRHDDAGGDSRQPSPTGQLGELPSTPSPRMARFAIQRRAAPSAKHVDDPHAAAEQGVATASGTLPHAQQIQQAFGHHDVSQVRTQVGGAGADASERLGAQAYAYSERVAFAATSDLHTAAHEAAHVVQQRRGVSLPGGISSVGDSYERHADAVADAVVAGHSAEAILGDGGAAGGVTQAVQRKTESEPFVATSGGKDSATADGQGHGATAQEWMWTWGLKLNDSLSSYLQATAFDLPTTFAVWKGGSSSAFAKAMWAPLVALTGKGQAYATLTHLLTPDPLDPHINAGRDAAVAEKQDPLGNRIQPRGDRGWAEPVVAEVGKIVTKRVIESLARMMPRWLAARNQLALSSAGPAKTADRDPKQGEVVPSHPIDQYVVAGLENQVTAFLAPYRKANPDQKTLGDMHLGALRKVSYQWQHDQGAWNWVRVTSPDKATKEDVAFTLYGNATFAHTITDAAPLFGISNVEDLAEPARSEYGKHAATAKQPAKPGDDPGIDAPEQQMQTATALSDEAMIAEAAKTKQSGIAANDDGRKVILDRMNAGLQTFQMIQKQSEAMPRGGYEALLASAYQRLQQRAFRVADKSISVGLILPWDGQTQAQNDLLTEAFNGVSMAVKQYATFSSWPSSALATQELGWMYLKVACLSEQASAGQEALAAANQQSKLFPVTVMELVLAEIRKVLHTEAGAKLDKKVDSSADAHDERTNLKEHDLREAKLRIGLARIRDKLLQNQKADEDLKQLQKELADLENEVSIVADMDAMDRAWQALYNDISAIGVISGSNSDDLDKINGKKGHDPKTDPSLRELRDDWERIYARYRCGDKSGALEELKAKRPKWTQLYANIGKLIQHNETKNKWVTFGAMVGIALITAGVGAYVEGAAAAAWGASSWATFAVTTGAEATTFTALSYNLVEKEPTIGGFFLELGKNLVMFGALKGVANKYISYVGKDVAGTADTMLVQFVSINTASLVEADVKKYATSHNHLTLDEVMEISKQNAIFTIASGLATMAARPGLEGLKLTGEANTALSRVRTLKAGLRDLATQVESTKTTDTRKVGELIAKQRQLLIAEDDALKTLAKLASDPKAAQKAGIDEATKTQIDADRKAHDETSQVVKLATIIQYTEGAGPVRYVEHGAKYNEVVQFWKGQDGTKVQSVPVDPQFGSRAFEITTKDGDTFRLIERTADDAKAVTKSAIELDQSADSSSSAATTDHTVPDAATLGRTVESYAVELLGQTHTLRIVDRGNGEFSLVLCSNCGFVLTEIDAVLADTSAKGPTKSLRVRLERLRAKVVDLEARMSSGKTKQTKGVGELQQIAAHLGDLSKKFPSANKLCIFCSFEGQLDYDQMAKNLGFERIGARSHGQPVYRRGNEFISPDVDRHNRGVWKKASGDAANLRNRAMRDGTYNEDLTEMVGP